MTIPLQTGYVYGPIVSRRFGSSLGINILPIDKKVCNFNCVYCQYGASVSVEDFSFPPFRDIRESVERHFGWMQSQGLKSDWIMIAGNGEPTLHPDFPKIVDSLRALRDTYLAGVAIGILSNASTCFRPEIQDALSRLDVSFMKLDAGDPSEMRRLNAPQASCGVLDEAWTEILNGLYHLPKVVIQSMFVRGKVDNTDDRDVGAWMQVLSYIRPVSVQVYTVSRPTRVSDVLPVEKGKLEKIAGGLTAQTGIPASVYD